MRGDRKKEDLLQSGRAFSVERDAKVRVLELAGGKARVEFLEGVAASKEGWVLEGGLSSWLHFFWFKLQRGTQCTHLRSQT